MNQPVMSQRSSPFLRGLSEALPLLGGYIPVAISFGLIAVQAGFSPFEAIMISTLIYAGGSQFLFVGMVASGAPLWLVVILSLLINARHLVYGPNIAPWINSSRWWPWLMHGLTDQVFAISQSRLKDIPDDERVSWFAGLMLLAWASWIGGTAIGALGGESLTTQWPMFGEITVFALPALFLVLLAPVLSTRRWRVTVAVTTTAALLLALFGFTNLAVPFSAFLGFICYYALKSNLT